MQFSKNQFPIGMHLDAYVSKEIPVWKHLGDEAKVSGMLINMWAYALSLMSPYQNHSALEVIRKVIRYVPCRKLSCANGVIRYAPTLWRQIRTTWQRSSSTT